MPDCGTATSSRSGPPSGCWNRPPSEGLPVTVHRLGRIVGPHSTGYVNERDFLWSVLRAGVPAGIVPDLFEEETWTPVDHVAQALVHLCLGQRPPTATVFNHVTTPVRLSDVYDWLEEYGYPLRRMPLTQWRAELPHSSSASEAAATTLAFFDSWDADTDETTGPELRLGRVRADNVVTGLHGSGIVCPPVDRDLVFRYLDHCVATGTLPAPAGKQGHLAMPAK